MSKFAWGVLAGVLFCGWSMTLKAQVADARLEGTVVDETQAVIPGATVTVKNAETGVIRSAVTDQRGRYAFANLPPAPHDIEVAMTGFRTTVRQGITLTVGAQVVVDITLTIGAATEQVTVTGEAPLVETRSGTVAGVVEQRVIQELPLNGRSFGELTQLEPGVIRTRAASKAGRCSISSTDPTLELPAARFSRTRRPSAQVPARFLLLAPSRGRCSLG